MTERRSTKPAPRRRLSLILAGGIAGVAVGLAGVYGISLFLGNAAIDPACRPAVETAQRIAPFARGEVAAMSAAQRPIRLPDLAFRDGRRHRTPSRRLARTHGAVQSVGHLVRALPQGDAGARRIAGEARRRRFRGGGGQYRHPRRRKPRAWLKEVGIERLAYYADPAAKVFQDLKQVGKAWGMPTTLLVDGAGCEIGTLAGPAEWASDDAIKLVSAALGK